MSFAMASSDPLSHVVQHPLKTIHAEPGFFTPNGVVTVLSDQIVMMMAGTLLLLIFFPLLVRRRRSDSETGRLVPSGFGNFVELVCDYLREKVARPALGPYTDRFIKYIWSAFFFILTMNLLGLIPFGTVFPVLFGGLHIGGTPTANIWMTGTLAAMTLFLMVFNGLRLGGKEYLAHFSPGPLFMAPIMVPIEIIGTVAKACALALRLFAAMVGGHILLAVLIGLCLMAVESLPAVGGFPVAIIVVLASAGVSLVEIFVAFLQAFIFSYLSALFIGMSVNLHHDDHAGEAGAH